MNEISQSDLAVFHNCQARHLTDRQLSLYLEMLADTASSELRPLVVEAVRRLRVVVPGRSRLPAGRTTS